MLTWLAEPTPGDAQTTGVLVITEIHYHPAGGGARHEFVELCNASPEPLDLSGWFFSSGISFVFPDGTWLTGGEYLVVCADEDLVQAVYGIDNTIGNWSATTRLDNGGEAVELSESSGVVATRVEYNDRGRWAGAADGTGHSLELRDIRAAQDDPENWWHSGSMGGSPGRANEPALHTIAVVINEALLPDSGERWVELYNTKSEAVDLSGYHVTNSRGDLRKAQLPASTEIPGRGWLSFRDTDLGLDFTPSVSGGIGPARTFVALTNPSGDRVIDSRSFEPEVKDRSEARFPDGSARFSPRAVPTKDATNQIAVETNIVINEVLYHPIDLDPDAEFIEIYNRDSDPVDISGWEMTSGFNWVFPPATIINGDGYLVLARNPEHIRSTYGLAASAVQGPDPGDATAVTAFGRLRDDGECIRLVDENGNTADSVCYHDGGQWPVWADGSGSSMELIDAFSNNDVGSAWDASDDAAEAQVEEIEYDGYFEGGGSELHFFLTHRGITLIDDVRVFEYSDDPDKGGTLDTGTNFQTNGDFETELPSNPNEVGAWVFEGTHVNSGRITAGALAGNGSLKIVATGKGDNKVNRIEATLAKLTSIAHYRIAFKAKWVIGSPVLLTRGYNHEFARAHHLTVPATLGTPGAMNSVTAHHIAKTGSSNLGPVISDVRHSPILPGKNEDVVISGHVEDFDGVDEVVLVWSHDTPSALANEIVMSGPDADGRFNATVPAIGTTAIVVYHIEATDTGGRTGRHPTEALDRTHPRILDPANTSVADGTFCVYGHDTYQDSSRPQYRFWMRTDHEIYLGSRRVQSNDPVPGTFVCDNTGVYPGAETRFSGSAFSRQQWQSMRVRMPKDRVLHGWIKKFNLEQHQGAGGRDARERISHYLLRHHQGHTRVPHAYSWLATWKVNRRSRSLLDHVDYPNREYIQRWYPEDDDGDFFEMDDRFTFNDSGTQIAHRDARWLYPPYRRLREHLTPDDPEKYRFFFNPRMKRRLDDWTHVVDTAVVFDPRHTQDEVFDDIIEDYIDMEAFLRVWAIRINIDDWDSWGVGRGKNAYFYRPAIDGRWTMIAWDMELTYEFQGRFMPPAIESSYNTIDAAKFREVFRLINRPRFKRMFYGIMWEMLDRPFNPDFLSPYMALLDDTPVSRTDVGKPGGHIDIRGQRVRSTIEGSAFPMRRLEITTNGGEPLSADEPMITIEGQAPVDALRILLHVEGQPEDTTVEATFSNSDYFSWSAEVPLAIGENVVHAMGMTSRDEVLDADSIEVVVGTSGGEFVRGDVDLLRGLNITDALLIPFYIFGGRQLPCEDAADVNDDGAIGLDDALTLLEYLFLAGPRPPAPFPAVGVDLTDDTLTCDFGL